MPSRPDRDWDHNLHDEDENQIHWSETGLVTRLSQCLRECYVSWVTDPGPVRHDPAGVGARLGVTRSSTSRSQRRVTALVRGRVTAVARAPDQSLLLAGSTALPGALQRHANVLQCVCVCV